MAMSTVLFGYSPPNPPTEVMIRRLEQLVAADPAAAEKFRSITPALQALAQGVMHQSHIHTLFCLFRDLNTAEDTRVARAIHDYVYPVVVTNLFDQLAMAVHDRKTLSPSEVTGKVDLFIRAHRGTPPERMGEALRAPENLELFAQAVDVLENVLMPVLIRLGRGRKEIISATVAAARDYLAFARSNG